VDAPLCPGTAAASGPQTGPPAFRFEETVDQCDVCGAATFRPIAPDADIVECAGCGYRFVSPRPSQVEIAAAYSEPHFYDGWIEDDASRLAMWRKRLDLVRRVATGRSVLDIGAGIGTFLALARDRAGWAVAGTEVSSAAVGIARQRHRIELLLGQAEALPLPPGAFSTVTLWHVLEHVPSPSRLLHVCHATLAPGGRLLIACPNDDETSQLSRRVKAWVHKRLGRSRTLPSRYERLRPGSEIHLSHFTLPVLRRLLKKEGFRVVRVTVDDHYPRPGWKTNLKVAVYRSILRLTGRNLGVAVLVVAER
jgi:ubiquinone/menaquinone biosynthesis C-methylase UbiE